MKQIRLSTVVLALSVAAAMPVLAKDIDARAAAVADRISALDSNVPQALAYQAKAQCWADWSRGVGDEAARRAIGNAEQIVSALYRGEVPPADDSVFASKVYPSPDPARGQPRWLADIRQAEAVSARFAAKRCITPASACLEVATQGAFLNLAEVRSGRKGDGGPAIAAALEWANLADAEFNHACSAHDSSASEKSAALRPMTRNLAADVLFPFGSSTLTPEGIRLARQVAKEYREISKEGRIEITGFTDRIGSTAYNEELSARRAQAVKTIFNAELPGALVEAIGAGSAEPIVDCPGPNTRAVTECLMPNRRVLISAIGTLNATEASKVIALAPEAKPKLATQLVAMPDRAAAIPEASPAVAPPPKASALATTVTALPTATQIQEAATAVNSPTTSPAPGFSVVAGDKTIRDVLVRWATQAGWTHTGMHWTVNKDHPIEGSAGADVFGNSFEQAVRVLTGSTELTDQPVQPCFYTNRVLRIIPAAASCTFAE